MVAATINEPDPTAPKRTSGFLLLTRRAHKSIGKLAKAIRPLEDEAVARLDPGTAAGVRARFEQTRSEVTRFGLVVA